MNGKENFSAGIGQVGSVLSAESLKKRRTTNNVKLPVEGKMLSFLIE